MKKINFTKANMFGMLQELSNYCSTLDDKNYTVEVKELRNKRSLNANAYFHLLVDKIAKSLNKSSEEVKKSMVLDYGAIMVDEDGDKVGIKIPKKVNVNQVYKYAKWFDTREENGIEFNCYIIFKETHNLNTKEMAMLIDGVVQEAEQLGIETITPEEIERLKNLWL